MNLNYQVPHLLQPQLLEAHSICPDACPSRPPPPWTLIVRCNQDHREPESAVRLFGVDLLAGLQQTHACGFLHGDLNPSNVLIDEYGILKLSGFGLARSIPERGEKEDQAVKKDGQQAASAAGTQVGSVLFGGLKIGVAGCGMFASGQASRDVRGAERREGSVSY